MQPDNIIFSEVDLDSPVRHEFLSGNIFIYTHKAPNKETVNEDSVAVIPFDQSSGIMLVADGLGGLPAGATASRIAVESFSKQLSTPGPGANLRDLIIDSFELSNEAILKQGSGAATTLAVLEIQDNIVRPYHVGDSKILVCGQKGKIKVNTVSHSPVEYAVEAGMLDENEAVLHEERYLVSNIVGAHDMSISIGASYKLAKFDTLLIASDGLFDNLYIDEIVEIVRKGQLDDIAMKLVSECHSRMNHSTEGLPSHADDLSFILFRLQ